MLKILLSGCSGKMGKSIINVASGMDDLEIVCGYDITANETGNFPVYDNLENCKEDIDVIIDFSHPNALPPLLKFALDKKLPIVIATTGFSEQTVEDIKKAAESIPVFYSGNMSLGINLLIELVKKAENVLGSDFDIEIVEKHHNQKIDAPSGTALMIADAISEEIDTPVQYEYDRHSRRIKRPKNEIGIHSIRGGTIVGEHDVIFAGCDEIITVSHTALSKNIFAVGSLNAARFLFGKSAGIYNMGDLVSLK